MWYQYRAWWEDCLAKAKKKIQKLYSQPNGIDYEELRYTLLKIGCDERQGGKGSHVIFTHREIGVSITVPIRRPLKRF